MKGLLPNLVSLVMPQNPQNLEQLRRAMVLAEQNAKASAKSVSVASLVKDLRDEIHCLRNQLSEVLALQNVRQPYSPHADSTMYQFPQQRAQQPGNNQVSWMMMMSSGLTTHQPMRVICVKMVN